MRERLAGEIMDAVNSTGGAVKKTRRYAQNGRSKQGFCTLQMVICNGNGHELLILTAKLVSVQFLHKVLREYSRII